MKGTAASKYLLLGIFPDLTPNWFKEVGSALLLSQLTGILIRMAIPLALQLLRWWNVSPYSSSLIGSLCSSLSLVLFFLGLFPLSRPVNTFSRFSHFIHVPYYQVRREKKYQEMTRKKAEAAKGAARDHMPATDSLYLTQREMNEAWEGADFTLAEK